MSETPVRGRLEARTWCDAIRLCVSGVPRQVQCDEIFSILHHLLPHFVSVPLLIEEGETFVPVHRAAAFVCQSHDMRK